MRSRPRSAPLPRRPGVIPSPDATSGSRPSPSSGGITLARRGGDDPVGVFRRAVRKDRGKVSLPSALAQRLMLQYRDHPHWSYQLHYDNLAALVKADPALGPPASYSTVRRYMQAHGWVPQAQATGRPTPRRGSRRERRQTREVRSYEAAHVGSLWHSRFPPRIAQGAHAQGGQWLRPIALGILDDHSRLCCHVQWYLSETAEDLVHGLSQAIQKRGLPRALLTDNGSAMVAEEVTEGLLRLGIVPERTLPYSPYQKGYTSSCTSFVSSLETLGNRRGSVNSIPCRLSGPFVPTGSYRYSGLLW